MKITINKNAKRVLSLVLALAVLVGSLFVANVGVTLDSKAETAVEPLLWEGNVADGFLDDSEGTIDDPIIISTPAELAFLAKGANNTTAGKYYKAADNLVFNLNGMTGITSASTSADVQAAATVKNWSNTVFQNDTKCFAGTFDGNGIVIYNAYGKVWSSGLFPVVDGNATVKNIILKASRFESQGGAYTGSTGAIIGIHKNTGGTSGVVTVSGISIENCYVANAKRDATGYGSDGTAGVIIGGIAWAQINIYNCLVKGTILSLNKESSTSWGGLIGGRNSMSSGTVHISNSIVLGIDPWSTGNAADSSNYTGLSLSLVEAKAFSNVYTDQNVDTNVYSANNIKQLTTAQMTGLAATQNMALDFGGIWFANTAGVPELRVFHNISGVDNGNGTHSETCADCGLIGLTVNHLYNIVDYTTDTSSCACGAFIYGTNDVWDGTKAAAFDSGSGTEADPYIIKTVEQLFLMVRSTGLNADGTPVYYKVADSVNELYINDTRGFADQAAFEAAAASLKNWSTGLTTEAQFCGDTANCYSKHYNNIYLESSTPVLNNHRDGYVDYFGGRFDGNGVTIYGLYSETSAANHWNNGVGFVPMLTGDAVIKNVTFDTNYVKSNSAATAVISASAGIWDGQYNSDTDKDGSYETFVMCPEVDAYAKRPENCNAAIINVAVRNSYLSATNYSNNSFVSGFVSSIRAPKSLKFDNCMFDGTNATFIDNATGTKNHVAFVTTQETNTNSVLAGCVNVIGESNVDKFSTFETSEHDKLDENGDKTGEKYTVSYVINSHSLNSNEFTVSDAPLLNWLYWETGDGITTLKNNTSWTADTYRNQGEYDLSWRKNKIITSTDQYEGFDFSKLRNDRGVFNAYNTLIGSGTETDPYIINDADTLYLVIASGGTKLGVPQHFKLGCNIDLEGKQWVDTDIFENTTYDVVFYQYLPFAGTIDGDGHTIYNLYTADDDNAGFIPVLAGGTIKNLHFRNAYVASSEKFAGVIAGLFNFDENIGSIGGTIENCSVENSKVSCANNGDAIGAIAGYSDSLDNSEYGEVIYSYTIIDNEACYFINVDDAVTGGQKADVIKSNLDTSMWYLGGNADAIPRLIENAKAQPCADIDADGVGEEYTTSDITALKNNLLWEDGYDYIYGDVTGNGTIDMRDLAALQRQMTGQETTELDGFWPNVKAGNFTIYYNDKDNYDFARKLELYLESKADVDVPKTFGTSGNNCTITLKTEGAANAYSVNYDAQNAKLTISGGSFTAVEEAVDRVIAETTSAGVPAISGTIATEKNAVTVNGSTYYYAWGDEFNSDVAGTVSYDKWMTRNKTTDKTPNVVDSDFEGMRDPTDEEAIKINQVKDGKLTLKRGFTGASSGYKYYMSGIGTRDSMLFKQGYLEMVATVPSDGYAFPAWWLLTHTGNKSNEMVDASLYSKVFERNPAYNGTTRIPTGADVTSFKYKLPTQTLEMDLFEIIQRPVFESDLYNKVNASSDHNIKFNIHKWYSYSLDKTDTSMTVYDLDWSKGLTTGAFPTKLLTASGSNGENYKKSSSSILFNTDNLAGGGVNGAVTYEGNHDTMQYDMKNLRSNNQITARRYGFLWTENEMTFIVYDGTAADAGVLYKDTVRANEMNFGGSESYYNTDNYGFGQYAYMLIENHIFTSSSHFLGRGVASGIGACDLVIDYVRIYQLDGHRAIITPESEALSSR